VEDASIRIMSLYKGAIETPVSYIAANAEILTSIFPRRSASWSFFPMAPNVPTRSAASREYGKMTFESLFERRKKNGGRISIFHN
jgi:hypothetical protein